MSCAGAVHPFFLLIIPVYLAGTFVLLFIAGFAFRKGWDLAAPKERQPAEEPGSLGEV